jgi:soluble lytic murein transglycosylase
VGHSFARGRLLDYRAHWPAGRWRLPWEVAYPRAFDAMVLRESESTRIPPPLTWAIMREESAFNPDAKSPVNAVGLMQLMANTARLVARDTPVPFDETSLHRPEVSIALGTRLLSSLRTSFPLHPAFSIAAYNGGSNAVRRWLAERGGDDFDVFVERIPYDETRNYVKKVLASEAAYAFLYAPAALDEVLAMPAKLADAP